VAGAAGALGVATRAGPSSAPLQRWERSEGESHPTHQDVDDATSESSTDCGSLQYSIDVLIRDLRFRRWDMQRRGGGDRAHQVAYAARQASLRRLVDVARALQCPYDPEADVETTLPPTFPTPSY